MTEHDLYHLPPIFAPTLEQWQRRCEESQYRSNLRRIESEAQRHMHLYRVTLVALALVTLAVIVGYLLSA